MIENLLVMSHYIDKIIKYTKPAFVGLVLNNKKK